MNNKNKKVDIQNPVSFIFNDTEITFNPSVINPPPLQEKIYPVVSLALDVSGTCNMNCIYCAESSTMPKRLSMSQRILKKSIKSLFEWSSFPKLSIHVGSGEPFLQPDLVHTIGAYARTLQKKEQKKEQKQKKDREVSLHITTNGTLLTEDIYTWLLRDKWTIKVSLDGPASIHDQNRKDKHGQGTFKKIKPVITQLCHVPGFSTTSVLCHNTDPADVFYGIAALNVKKIELVPVAVKDSDLQLTKTDIKKYRQFIAGYVKKIVQNEPVPWLTRFVKKVQRVMGYGATRIPCGAGRTFIAVGPKGVIYPCFRFVGIEKYELGHIDTGINEEKALQFAADTGRPYNQRNACTNCWAAPLCGGPCFACADLIYDKNGEPAPEYCDMVRADCEAAVWLVNILKKENPELLLKFLGVSTEDV
ncbi:MAG: radical SAM protein [Candidatus Methanofastidiosia archaeon]|jgi:uncharacterized protein